MLAIAHASPIAAGNRNGKCANGIMLHLKKVLPW